MLSKSPAEQLGLLHTLFSGIKNRINEPGEYLLRHDSKSGAFVKVERAVAVAGSGGAVAAAGGPLFDLQLSYANSRACEERDAAPPAWSPIDVSVVTPWHMKQRRAPVLFAPKPLAGGGKRIEG